MDPAPPRGGVHEYDVDDDGDDEDLADELECMRLVRLETFEFVIGVHCMRFLQGCFLCGDFMRHFAFGINNCMFVIILIVVAVVVIVVVVVVVVIVVLPVIIVVVIVVIVIVVVAVIVASSSL